MAGERYYIPDGYISYASVDKEVLHIELIHGEEEVTFQINEELEDHVRECLEVWHGRVQSQHLIGETIRITLND